MIVDNRDQGNPGLSSDTRDLAEDVGVDGSNPSPRTNFPDETPGMVAQVMIRMAEIRPRDLILEPSAGYGVIADRIKFLYPDNDLICVELNEDRARVLQANHLMVQRADFLTWNFAAPDRVIMNPPKRSREHIEHAFSLLRPGGIIVALTRDEFFQGPEFDCSYDRLPNDGTFFDFPASIWRIWRIWK